MMKTNRLLQNRLLHRLALGASILTLFAGMPAAAQDHGAWPQRPLKLIIPFPPGGAADTIGRTIATELGAQLGQPVVAENRPGAGTAIAAEAASRAAPDGYTLSLATTGQLTILPALRSDLPFDPVRSFTPIGLVAEVPYIVSVAASAPDQDLASLVARAGRQGEVVSYSSCGTGTVCHLAGELLGTVSDTKLLHVPFAGSAPAIQAVLGGHVQVAVDTAAVQAPHIRAGTLRPLALSSTTRSAALPDVPTAAEAGLPGFIATSWFGVVVPSGTPEPVAGRLSAALQQALSQARVRQTFDGLGLTALDGKPATFSTQIQQDLKKWNQVVKTASVTIE
ncbi:Tricarboxylate transport protein TctC [Orrella dioscoreae]|uniref:Tricarboxylate transport protein TctC n=1 Tax=Orrella dioscoreae TaxID=1851544 RepID=A0A1C3K6R3_9BURK|nr:Tricarboxylate transport protein TctC [Orrella dioscoreae]SOE52652.1 Tricarboxylate transport protein TctC [Orrella dioscoreae]